MSTVLKKPRERLYAVTEVHVPEGFEYVDGKLIRKHMSVLSSWIAGQTFEGFARHVREHDLPHWVFPEGNSYRCFPGDPLRSRRADTSVVLFERLPGGPTDDAHLPFPPDLAVEVLSPSDRTYDSDRKLMDYETAGVRLVWVVHPVARTVRVIDRDAGTDHTLRIGGTLTGGAVLPELSLPVIDIFPPTHANEAAAGETAADDGAH